MSTAAHTMENCRHTTAAVSTIFVQTHSGDNDEDALTITAAAVVEMIITNIIYLCPIMFK